VGTAFTGYCIQAGIFSVLCRRYCFPVRSRTQALRNSSLPEDQVLVDILREPQAPGANAKRCAGGGANRTLVMSYPIEPNQKIWFQRFVRKEILSACRLVQAVQVQGAQGGRGRGRYCPQPRKRPAVWVPLPASLLGLHGRRRRST